LSGARTRSIFVHIQADRRGPVSDKPSILSRA
jgi:hypothetical protein